MAATAATNAPETRQTTEGRKRTNNLPLMPVNAASVTAAEPVAHGAVPHRIECCCTFKNRLLCQVMILFEQHAYFVQRRSRAWTYRRPCSSSGRLALWAHSTLFSGLGAASTAAGRYISAGSPPRPLTRFRV